MVATVAATVAATGRPLGGHWAATVAGFKKGQCKALAGVAAPVGHPAGRQINWPNGRLVGRPCGWSAAAAGSHWALSPGAMGISFSGWQKLFVPACPFQGGTKSFLPSSQWRGGQPKLALQP